MRVSERPAPSSSPARAARRTSARSFAESFIVGARRPGPHRSAALGSGPSRCENPSIVERYQRPGWFTEHVFNRVVAWLTRRGLSVAGSRVLEVRGRKTGEPRRTPVNMLTFEGARYLVAPRGHTQWVRNLRARGEGRLLLGRRAEQFTAAEVSDDDKPALLRAYLKRWKWEVGAFFDGVGPNSGDDELRRIAPDHPVFRISPAAR
jgi:deazaflavin-dependent oxidoreductase (nitroreductase family)